MVRSWTASNRKDYFSRFVPWIYRGIRKISVSIRTSFGHFMVNTANERNEQAIIMLLMYFQEEFWRIAINFCLRDLSDFQFANFTRFVNRRYANILKNSRKFPSSVVARKSNRNRSIEIEKRQDLEETWRKVFTPAIKTSCSKRPWNFRFTVQNGHKRSHIEAAGRGEVTFAEDSVVEGETWRRIL